MNVLLIISKWGYKELQISLEQLINFSPKTIKILPH